MIYFIPFIYGMLYLSYRVVRVLERWVVLYGQRQETAQATRSPSSVTGTPSQIGETTKKVRDAAVPVASPDIVLKRAPKPAGFGGSTNGSKQCGSTDPQSGSQADQTASDTEN